MAKKVKKSKKIEANNAVDIGENLGPIGGGLSIYHNDNKEYWIVDTETGRIELGPISPEELFGMLAAI